MANVSTSVTTGVPIDYPAHATIVRSITDGYLYVFGRLTATTYQIWRSTDSGGSWTPTASFTRTGIVEWSSLVVDRHGSGHIAYRFSDASVDAIFYRRVDLTYNTWGAEVQVSLSDANGGVPGSTWTGVDIAVVRNSDGSFTIAIPGYRIQGTTRYGVQVMGVTITPQGVASVNTSIFSNSREFWTSGTAPGRSTPTCEIEHNGTGFDSSTPNLWITWGRDKLYMVKMSWLGSGWQGPSTFQTIDSSIPNVDYVAGRWDGTRWMMAVIDTTDTTTADVYERNQANSLTTVRQTPSHTNGVIRTLGLSYDYNSGNIRVFAVGTTNATLYFVDFVRSTGLWGSWAQVSADVISATPPDEYTLRRGGTSGNARHDIVYTVGTGSPWTIKHLAQTVGYAPNTPTWDTSAGVIANGAAADVNASLPLDWTFTDNDPADTQSAYALRRQIGAGSFSYYTAAGGTWGGTEVFNTSSTTAVTVASGWGAGTDANHAYAVKVRDTATLDSPYSASLVLIPSVKVNPSITAPTAAQVLGTNTVTVTWTAGEQTQYRIQLLTNPGLVQVYDSNWVSSAALSVQLPYVLDNGTGWRVQLTTKNNEGLASTVQTRDFTVVYAAPPAPISTLTASTTNGQIAVAASALAAVGVQPAISTMDLYRRIKTTSILNTNTSMAGNVTGWSGVGTTSMAYSTSQFHDSPGAAFATPTGVAALSLIRHTALIDIVAGQSYLASGWIRPTTSNKPVQINLDWYTAASAFISSTTVSVTAVGTAWMYLEVSGDPATVATAAKVTMSVGESGTPAAGDTFYGDELELTVFDRTTGTRVATSQASTATINDWRAAARTEYEYRWVAYGTNGTSITGPWTS